MRKIIIGKTLVGMLLSYPKPTLETKMKYLSKTYKVKKITTKAILLEEERSV